MRKLLVVAFHYPPDNTSTGVLRTLKFTQYLGKHGWASEVLSVPTERYPSCDDGLRAQIPPHANVTRTWAPDLSKSLSVRGRYPGFLTFPDRYWPWCVSAVRAGLRLIREHRVEAIFATSPVPSALLIGLLLKRLTGLPLIIDFRDPWVDNATPPVRRFFESWLERRFMRGADRIICNTPALRRSFLGRYPEVPPERFVTITNGYDERDFADLEVPPSPHFEIIYAGMLQREHRNPDPLLRAVRLALDRGWIERADLHLSFLGADRWGGSQEFADRLAELGLTELTEVRPERIGYRDSLRRMAAASVLLVLLHGEGQKEEVERNREWWGLTVPAKVYEYLRIGRQMMVIVDGGAVGELLHETGGGSPVPPHDVEFIASELRELYRRWKAGELVRRTEVPPQVQRYSRESLAARLAEELDTLCGPAGPVAAAA